MSGLITVSDRGQIAIPIHIRKNLNIEKGQKLLLTVRGHNITLERAKHPLEALRGMLKTKKSSQQIKNEIREEEAALETKKVHTHQNAV